MANYLTCNFFPVQMMMMVMMVMPTGYFAVRIKCITTCKGPRIVPSMCLILAIIITVILKHRIYNFKRSNRFLHLNAFFSCWNEEFLLQRTNRNKYPNPYSQPSLVNFILLLCESPMLVLTFLKTDSTPKELQS